MTGPEPNGIIAVFPDHFSAESALDWLRVSGIDKRSVSVIGPKEAAVDPPQELDQSKEHRREIAGHWARWGGMLGGTVAVGPAAMALAAALVGLGPVAVALAAGLAAFGAAAGAGAIGSALVGVGVHERHARHYEACLAAGKFLLVLHTDDVEAIRTARSELERLGAESVDAHGLPVFEF